MKVLRDNIIVLALLSAIVASMWGITLKSHHQNSLEIEALKIDISKLKLDNEAIRRYIK